MDEKMRRRKPSGPIYLKGEIGKAIYNEVLSYKISPEEELEDRIKALQYERELLTAIRSEEDEVVEKEIPETDIVEELYGIASNVKMSKDDIRRERLAKHEAAS